jgi:hypothetical protein
MPVSIYTMVDFPAPFSPISAVTSPALRLNVTSCKARTPGKDFETPDRDKIGVFSGAAKCVDVDKVSFTNMASSAKAARSARFFGSTGNAS